MSSVNFKEGWQRRLVKKLILHFYVTLFFLQNLFLINRAYFSLITIYFYSYRGQFSMLAETISQEKHDLQVRQKAQNQVSCCVLCRIQYTYCTCKHHYTSLIRPGPLGRLLGAPQSMRRKRSKKIKRVKHKNFCLNLLQMKNKRKKNNKFHHKWDNSKSLLKCL